MAGKSKEVKRQEEERKRQEEILRVGSIPAEEYKRAIVDKETGKIVVPPRRRQDDQPMPTSSKEAIMRLGRIRIQVREIMENIEQIDVSGYSAREKAEIQLLAQYLRDRSELCYIRIMELVQDGEIRLLRARAEEKFYKTWHEFTLKGSSKPLLVSDEDERLREMRFRSRMEAGEKAIDLAARRRTGEVQKAAAVKTEQQT